MTDFFCQVMSFFLEQYEPCIPSQNEDYSILKLTQFEASLGQLCQNSWASIEPFNKTNIYKAAASAAVVINPLKLSGMIIISPLFAL